MKKLICFILCALMLTAAVSLPVGAEVNVGKVVNVYFRDQVLTVFLSSEDAKALEEASIFLNVDGQTQPYMTTAKRMTDADTSVNYLILIDASDSMWEFRDQTRRFVKGMLRNEKQPYTVTVAAFGASFRVLKENLTGESDVLAAIDRISYTDTVSEICDGLLYGIEYQTKLLPANGEIQNIVLMTDGDTYMREGGRSDEAIRNIASITKGIVRDSSEYLIHTVSMGEWNALTYDAVSVSPGVDLTIPYSSDAYAYGAQISSYVDGLYRVDMDYRRSDYSARFDADLVASTPSSEVSLWLPLKNVRNLDVKEYPTIPHFDEEGNVIGYDPAVILPPVPTTGLTPTEIPSPTVDVDPTAGADEPTAGTEATESAAPATVDETGGDTLKILGLEWWLFALIIGGALLVILLLIVLLLSASRKKKKAQDRNNQSARTVAPPPMQDEDASLTGNYILVIPEILYGKARCASDELKLYRQLIIGTAPDCDIVVEDSMASEHNTRVFVENGMIYIEDLNVASCTYLGGMKIFAKNRLRSGEEIMVGDTVFKLRF